MTMNNQYPALQIVHKKRTKPAESPLSRCAIEDLLAHGGDLEALRKAYETGYRQTVALVITDLCRTVLRLEREIERPQVYGMRRAA